MAEGLVWLGACLVVGSVMGAVGSGFVVGILTPTTRSPARPGDLEGRLAFQQQLKIELGVGLAGVTLLFLGIAAQVA